MKAVKIILTAVIICCANSDVAKHEKFGQHCYFYNSKKLTKDGAARNCETKGATLLSVKTENDHRAGMSLSGANLKKGGLIWLNAQENGQGILQWGDGTNVNNNTEFLFWRPGNDSHGNCLLYSNYWSRKDNRDKGRLEMDKRKCSFNTSSVCMYEDGKSCTCTDGTCVVENCIEVCTTNPTTPTIPAVITSPTTPKNSCIPNPCGTGTCSVTSDNKFDCVCPTNYSGNKCQNSCSRDTDCGHRGSCVKLLSSGKSCTCTTGLSGLRCETCNKTCNGHGTCNVANASCVCENGWSGTSCQTSPCRSDTCYNGGTCVVVQTTVGYLCSCPSYYTGDRCQHSCASNSECGNGGTCSTGTNGGNSCSCASWLKGLRCDRCSNNCNFRGTCNVTTGACVCQIGWSDLSCTTYTCPLSCSTHSTCPSTSKGESPKCDCYSGYTGPLCNLDILEISAQPSSYYIQKNSEVKIGINVITRGGSVSLSVTPYGLAKPTSTDQNGTVYIHINATRDETYTITARIGSFTKQTTVKITIWEQPVVSITPPLITLKNDEQTSFCCKSTAGVPTPTLVWYKDGKKIPVSWSRGIFVSKKSGCLRLNVANADVTDTGLYICSGSNDPFGNGTQFDNKTAQLSVPIKSVSRRPSENAVIMLNETITLECTFRGSLPLSIKWEQQIGKTASLINGTDPLFEITTINPPSTNLKVGNVTSKLTIKFASCLENQIISCSPLNGDPRQHFKINSHINVQAYKFHGTKYYIVSKAEKSKADAQKECESIGGTLVNIKDIETQNFIATNLKQDGYHYYYTGGQKNSENGVDTWKWSDGTKVFNGPWHEVRSSGSCLGMSLYSGKWNSISCLWSSRFICEKKVENLPVINSVSINKCEQTNSDSSMLTVRWSPSKPSIGLRHKLSVTPDISSALYEESFVLPTSQNVITKSFTNLSAFTNYTVMITIDSCSPGKKIGSSTKITTSLSIPSQPSYAAVNQVNETCTVIWGANDVKEKVQQYKITVIENPNMGRTGAVGNVNTTETLVLHTTDVANQSYTPLTKPNKKYNFTIQSFNCFGSSQPFSVKGPCVTSPSAPKSLPIPIIPSKISENGTLDIIVPQMDESNGPVSCFFVVMKEPNTIQQRFDSSNVNMNTLNNLENNTDRSVYISIAMKGAALQSDSTKITLGDNTTSSCDVNNVDTQRLRRDLSGSNQVSANNSPLDPNKQYSMHLLTTTPTNGEISVKASPEIKVNEITSKPRDSNAAVIALAIIIPLLIILLILIAIYLYRKKKQSKDTANDFQMQPTQAHGREVQQEDAIYVNVDTTAQEPSKTNIGLSQLEGIYNSMSSNDFRHFRDQFQKISDAIKGHPPVMDIGKRTSFRVKNRYKNILPSDSTRVVLPHAAGQGYINASFIDGFNHPKKFIATQGPLSGTINDFWEMVFHNRIVVIVMLTNLTEQGKVKCEKYWPDTGETKLYGKYEVTVSDEFHYCSFLCREVTIVEASNKENYWSIHQYHYTRWPDHGVPSTTTDILKLHDYIRGSQETLSPDDSPILIHCSAGAGRTGVLIAFDILLNESYDSSSIDAFNTVLKMRKCRSQMVQTLKQYVLLHKLILETHLFGETDIMVDSLRNEFNQMLGSREDLKRQFQNLSRIQPLEKEQAFGRSPENEQYNAHSEIVPYDHSKVFVSQLRNERRPPYINASYLHKYQSSEAHFIASQGPRKNSVEFFWRMLLDNNINTVVMLSQLNEAGYLQYWPEEQNKKTTYGHVSVTNIGRQNLESFTERTFQVVLNDNSITVTHLHFDKWEVHSFPQTIHVIKTYERVKALAGEPEAGGLTVHCSDGCGRTGVFCAMLNMLDRMPVENRCNVFRAVKDLRDCRPNMVSTLEQYKFCFTLVLDYLSEYEAYVNFAE